MTIGKITNVTQDTLLDISRLTTLIYGMAQQEELIDLNSLLEVKKKLIKLFLDGREGLSNIEVEKIREEIEIVRVYTEPEFLTSKQNENSD